MAARREAAAVRGVPAPPARAPQVRSQLSASTALQSRIGTTALAGLAQRQSPLVALQSIALATTKPATKTVDKTVVRPDPSALPMASAPASVASTEAREPPAANDTEPAKAAQEAPRHEDAKGGEATAPVARAAGEQDAVGEGKGAGKPAPQAELLMPEAPAGPSPATKKRIATVKARSGGKAGAMGALPAAGKQVADARKSVTPPVDEQAAKARAELMASIKAGPSPEIVKLAERIRKVIRDKRPPDEDALMEAKPDKAATEAGNTLNSSVTSDTNRVKGNYDGLEKAPVGAPAPQGAPVSAQPAATPTAPVNAAAASPDKVPAANVSLDADAERTRKQAEDAGMATEPAKLVQTGPIAEARNAQGELEDAAKTDPDKVLEGQKATLAKAQEDMLALQAGAADRLLAMRESTSGKLGTGQKAMAGSEEDMRRQAGADAEKAFDGAQSEVRGLLKDLTATAMSKWDAAKDVLSTQFKADLKVVQDRVEERHSGASGFVVGLWDAVTGLPDWAVKGYNDAEYNFSEGVIRELTTISAEVNTTIALCDKIIDAARAEIKRIYAALPDSLQAWAAGEQKKFDGQLDGLRQEAAAARDSFNKDLIERSSAAVDEVRAEISELRKKAGGLVGRIVDAVQRFIDDPVKAIIEGLLTMLGIPPAAFWAVVAKIKKCISDIADDPVRFCENLLSGIGKGFGLFFDNFFGHMFRGFLTWLLGDIKGVQIPKELSLKSIVGFFLQLAGITWPNIRKILVKKIGAKNVALIEKVWSLVSLLIEQGPQGIYDMIKEQLNPQAIVDQIVSMAVEYMVTAIAKQVAVRLLMLFNPAGAIVQALEAIYRVLKWVFQNAAKIFTLVETIVNGIADIIAGNVGGFAKAVEQGLAMLIAPVIGFLADYFSLGDLPGIVADKVKSMREWILGMIEKAIDWIIEKGKALLEAIGLGGKKKPEDKKGEGGAIGERVEFDAAGEGHSIWVETNGKNATVMVASTPMGVDQFLDSRQVQRKMKTDPALPGLVSEAKSLLKTVDMTADQLVYQLSQVTEEDKQPQPEGAQEKVVTGEKQLAITLQKIMEAVARTPEPLGGLHGYLSSVSKKDEQESHHVPAKAMGGAVAGVLDDVGERLGKAPWLDNPEAADLSKKLARNAQAVRALTTPPGNQLSAISVSHETHKGDAGIHSVGSAAYLAQLASDPGEKAILVCKRKTALEIQNELYVSVNPQVGGWRAFLNDVRQRVANAKHRVDPNTARDEKQVVEEILADAQAEFEEAELLSEQHLDAVMTKLQGTIAAAPGYAFESGLAIVGNAMEKTNEGTADGRAAAVEALRQAFETSWAPVAESAN